MIKKILPLVATGLGAVLLVLAAVWPNTVDKNMLWSPEQQQEMSDAVTAAHNAQPGHSHDDHSHDGSSEFEMSKERVRESMAALEHARNGHRNFITRMRWLGIMFVAVGGIGYYAVKNTGN